MPVSQDHRNLGGWTSDELHLTLQQSSGVGSDHDLDDVDRFVRGVASVVRKREAVDKDQEDPKALSVFLLSPDTGGHGNLNREPLLHAGLTTVAGKVWFVNPPVVAGKAKILEVEEADGVFRTVTDELELGDIPAVVVDPRREITEVHYYPKGLNEPDDCVPVRLHCSDIDLRQVCEVIDRVYRQCLITPDAQVQGNKLWHKASKFRPYRNAEHKVQAYLKPAFAAAFPTCRVYDESAGTMGRADLHLEEPDPLNREIVTFLAVLELKVLRSYSDEGTTSYSDSNVAEWIEEGVKQAGMYRKERGHRVAMLCCFDMRKDDSGNQCFEAGTHLADKLEVVLRRWYLYPSSKLARAAGASTTTSPV